jgi:hypothetical protein
MPRDDAVALMATTEARDLLPPVASVLRCPVLIESEPGRVEVLGKGYHAELGGTLIVEGEPPPQLPVEPAANCLRWLLQITSNGLEATRDLVNWASICRIFKRPGYQYRDTLGEVLRLQSTFLGAVFSIITAWIAAGKPRTQETRPGPQVLSTA